LKKKVFIPVILLILLEIVIVILFYQDSGISIRTEYHKWSIFGISFHANTMLMEWLVSFIMLIPGLIIGFKVKNVLKKLSQNQEVELSDYIPTRLQSVTELLVEFFDDLTKSTLKSRGRKYFPLIITLFVFIWISNMMGIFPSFWQIVKTPDGKPFLEWLEFAEPTRDLNVPVGLMLIVIFVVHGSMIKEFGIRGYLKSYADPIFLLFPLNVIGEIAKGISLAFRLFGNILGGAIIIIVVSSLVRYIVLPPLLNAFFGVFVGTIQAFVFSMLALTYTAVALADVIETDEEENKPLNEEDL